MNVGKRREAAKDHNLTVLHVTESCNGGVGTYFSIIRMAFCGDNVNNCFVVPSRHLESLRGLVEKPIVFKSRYRGWWTQVRMLMAVLHSMHELKAGVVVLHSTFALFLAPIVRLFGSSARLLYVPHGLAARQYEGQWLKHCVVKCVERTLLKVPHKVIYVSQWEYGRAIAYGYKAKCAVIENAVRDVLECTSSTQDARLQAFEGCSINLLFVGRFDEQKGLDILLSAFAEVAQIRTDLKLHVVGEAVRGDFTAPHMSDDVRERVFFYGWVGNDVIDQFFAAADLLVVPSRWEAFGLIVPEAFRNGTPVAVFQTDALPTLVSHGNNGFIVPFGTEGLERMLRGLARCKLEAMRPAARSSFEERFTVDRFRMRCIDELSCGSKIENEAKLR